MSSINSTPAQINPMGLNFIPLFPRELVHQTFKHLDLHSFLNSRNVCKAWKTALDVNELWKHFFEKKFISDYDQNESDFRGLYLFYAISRLRFTTLARSNLHIFHFPRSIPNFIAGPDWVAGFEESGTTIHIQDTCQYSKPWELVGHNNELTTLLFKESTLVSGDVGGTLKTWNLRRKFNLHSINAHNDAISCLLVKDDYLFTGSYDRTVKKWEVGIAIKNLKTLQVHSYGLSKLLAWEEKIVSISTAGEIVIWDPIKDISFRLNPQHNSYQQNEQEIDATAAIAGDYLFAGPLEGKIQRWNLSLSKLELQVKLKVADISVLEYHQSLLFSGDVNGQITFLDPLTLKALKVIRYSTQEIRSIAFTPNDFFMNGGEQGDKILRSSSYHKRKRQG